MSEITKFADFLFEIGTEELPPKELPNLVNALANNLLNSFTESGLNFANTQTFAAPRRLAVLVKDLQLQQPKQTISKRGPAITAAYNPDGSPTKAALGFASSCGVDMQELTKQETDKGAWLYFEQTVAGKQTIDLLPEIVTKAINKLPIKKPMHWGTGEFAFVRPVHWILMLLDKQIVNAKIFNLATSNYTYGHRIHCPKAIKILQPSTYAEQLFTEGKVIADLNTRKEKIIELTNTLAHKENGQAVINDNLLDMVTGLVEWPVALMAKFNPEFLTVPKECLISSMQDHQKCFALVNQDEELLPKFILISNLESTDPQTVIRGNELVMNARLADAAFYYHKDLQHTLHSRVEQLKTVVYQKKLGSVYDKIIRLERLAIFIAKHINADPKDTARAALLCKADLLTSMVYEFPELQGIMGCYYAKHDNEPVEVALAIQEHYLPRFSQDSLPNLPISICLALADRIDTLSSMFSIGMEPTGEKDPYGLRRQALAVLRILIEKNINLDLKALFDQAQPSFTEQLLKFSFERLKAWYLADGVPAKTFAAVMASNITSPLDFNRRIIAVTQFQALPAATSLAAANKRVQNILEKITDYTVNTDINNNLLTAGAEQELYQELQAKEQAIKPLVSTANYAEILQTLSTLQNSVDNYFTNVMVMVDDQAVRNNRLNLLHRLRNLFLQVADVSLL